jgi:hypothetical protein
MRPMCARGAILFAFLGRHYLFAAEEPALKRGRDSNQFDSRPRFLLKAGWRLPSVPVRAFVALEGIHRRGRIGDARVGSRETRTFAGLSYLF